MCVCLTEHETGHYFRVNRRQNIALPVRLYCCAGVFLFHKYSFVETRFYSFSRIPLRTTMNDTMHYLFGFGLCSDSYSIFT